MFETSEPYCSTTETSSILQLLNDDSRDDPLGTALDFCFTQKPDSDKQQRGPTSHLASHRQQSSVNTCKANSIQSTDVKASTNAITSVTKCSENQFARCGSSFFLELEDDDVKACTSQGSKKDDNYPTVSTVVQPANAGGFLLELESEDEFEAQPKVGVAEVAGKVSSDTSVAARCGISLELELDLDSPCAIESDSKPCGQSDSALWKTDSLNDNLLLEAERIALQSMQDTKNALASVSSVNMVRPCSVISPARFDSASRIASTPNAQRANTASNANVDVSVSDDSFVLPRVRRARAKRHIFYSQAMTQLAPAESISDSDVETGQKGVSLSDVDKSALTIDSQSESESGESCRLSDALADDVVVIGESVDSRRSRPFGQTRLAFPSTSASTRDKRQRKCVARSVTSPEGASKAKTRSRRDEAAKTMRRGTSRVHSTRPGCNPGRHAEINGNTNRKRDLEVTSRHTCSDTDAMLSDEADDESDKGAPTSKKRLRKNKKGIHNAFVWTQAVCKAVVSSDEDDNLDESAIARELASFVAPSQSQSQSSSQLDRSDMHAVYLRTIRDDALNLPANLASLLDRHTAPLRTHKRVPVDVTANEVTNTDLSNSYQFDSFCVPDDVL